MNLSVDFRYDGGIGRIACLEKLGDTRKTTGDVTCATCGTRYLHEDLASLHILVLFDHKVCTHRESVSLDDLAGSVHDICLGHLAALLGLDHDLLADTGLLVRLHAISDVLLKVGITDLTSHFADNDSVEGVPFAYHITLGDTCLVIEVELGTVRYVGVGEHHLGCWVHDTHLCESTYHNLYITALGVNLVGAHCAELVDLKHTVVA